MKKLRQSLALVLAVILLVSVIPFAAVAEEEYSAKFELATVNGQAYDGSFPINGGDTIGIAVIANPGTYTLKGWMLGYAYNAQQLEYKGVAFADG